MKLITSAIFIASTVFWLSSASAATESQLDSVDALGELNGVALQCKYLEQTQRIKLALVKNLPKQRELGEKFDNTTNQSFMNFMNTKSSCPDSQFFSGQVGLAILKLESAFAK
jgi:hypothetical protein